MAIVNLNKWDGQKFENNNRCYLCQCYAATRTIRISPSEVKDPTVCFPEDHIKIGICKSCLLDMVAEIDQVMLEAAANPNVRGKDACIECDGSGRINAWLHEGVRVIGCPTCKGTGHNNPCRPEARREGN